MTVRIGAHGSSASKVQDALIAAGARDNRGNAVDSDGKYGRLTREAVINFQRSHVDPQTGQPLRADGEVGPATARALGLTGDEFEPSRPPSNGGGGGGLPNINPGPSGGGGAAPVDPSGAPAIVMPPPGANPLQRATNLMNMETARLNFFRERGIPLPPNEMARAVSLKTAADGVDVILAQGELGRDLAEFGTARSNLADAIAAAQR